MPITRNESAKIEEKQGGISIKEIFFDADNLYVATSPLSDRFEVISHGRNGRSTGFTKKIGIDIPI